MLENNSNTIKLFSHEFHFVSRDDTSNYLNYLKERLGKKNYKETLADVFAFFRQVYDNDIFKLGDTFKERAVPKVKWNKHFFIDITTNDYIWLKRIQGVNCFFSMAEIVRWIIRIVYNGIMLLDVEGFVFFVRVLLIFAKDYHNENSDFRKKCNPDNIQLYWQDIHDPQNKLRFDVLLLCIGYEIRLLQTQLTT